MPTLAGLPLTLPVLAAPMAGGPTTPALVTAAAEVGSLGFLAGGYKTPEQLARQIGEVRAVTETFGVNLFAPNPVPVDPDAYARYAIELRPAAGRFGVTLPNRPVQDDDGWSGKLDLLLADPVPLVSFTFGVPTADVIRALRSAGSAVAQTVTNAEEAGVAAGAGVDLLIVQGSAAGGHSATLTPHRPPKPRPLPDLVREVAGSRRLPVVAAGGLDSSAAVAQSLRAGAAAAMVGTALLLTEEAGTSAVHRGAIVERSGPTVLTRAFTGRPARALPNEFTHRFDPVAPLGYPALHHLTSPLRRAAAAAGDAEWVHLWAGSGYPASTSGSAKAILQRLANG